MIENLKKTLVKLYQNDVKTVDLSVCSISTTNIVYLVFNNNLDVPDYAVRPIKNKAELDQFKLEKKLYNNLGSLVPKPINIILIDGKEFSVHKGIEGLPWFKLRKHFKGEKQWEELRRLALNTLATFSELIKSDPDFNIQFKPDDAIKDAISSFRENLPDLYAQYESTIRSTLQPLYSLNNVWIPKQHGDFCLNNFIINGHQCTVIDLEDFGAFKFPCYDAITLATTLNPSQPKNSKRSLQQEILECIACIDTSQKPSGVEVKALYLAYLLCRLGHWSNMESRQTYRLRLINDLITLLHEDNI